MIGIKFKCLFAHLLFLHFCCQILNGQEWTEPVQISNLQGLNDNPDFCFSNDGTIHCVWSYKIENNYRIILYSKSIDNGITWSNPQNVSQNTSMWMENPHIVSDSQNNLHITYDFNVYSPGSTLVVHQYYNGESWSVIDTISTGLFGSRQNRLVIDNNAKLFCFWFHDNQNGTTFYRTSENNTWTDIKMIYDDDDFYFLQKAIADSNNFLHCTGYHYYVGQSAEDQEIVYTIYQNDSWSEITEVSKDYIPWVGNDIALDNTLNPHITWRQTVSDSIPPNDATLYSMFDGADWTTPEIIVEDPSEQAIIIDKFNHVHIFDCEKYENGYRLVHYRQNDNEWIGQIVDENFYGFYKTKLLSEGQFIQLMYVKVDTVIGNQSQSIIIIRTYDVTTSLSKNNNIFFDSFLIFPNPVTSILNITYNLKKPALVEINLNTINGSLVKNLLYEKQETGYFEIAWNLPEEYENIKPGTYLLRLRIGKQIITKSVIFIN